MQSQQKEKHFTPDAYILLKR